MCGLTALHGSTVLWSSPDVASYPPIHAYSFPWEITGERMTGGNGGEADSSVEEEKLTRLRRMNTSGDETLMQEDKKRVPPSS